jgi:hypothetical protein
VKSRRWGPVGGSRSLEACPWELHLSMAFSCILLSLHPIYHDMSFSPPLCLSLYHDGLPLLIPRAKVNLSSLIVQQTLNSIFKIKIWFDFSSFWNLCHYSYPSLFFSLFIYSYVCTLFGSFLPPAPCPLPLPPTPLASRKNLFCPFLQFVEE